MAGRSWLSRWATTRPAFLPRFLLSTSTPPSLSGSCFWTLDLFPFFVMALTNAIHSLKIVGALAATVPAFGSQLEAPINVTNEVMKWPMCVHYLYREESRLIFTICRT